jgi:hypothetical protein
MSTPIKILSPLQVELATINVASSALRKEVINGENTLTFSIRVKDTASAYINAINMVSLGGDYFDLAWYKKEQQADGSLMISVECEHVSYRLNHSDYTVTYFNMTDTPTNILTAILADTDFTVGTVDFTDPVTFNPTLTGATAGYEMSRMSVLRQFIEQLGGEIECSQFEISILTARGSTTEKQLTVGQNVTVLSEAVDKRATDSLGNYISTYTVGLWGLEPTGIQGAAIIDGELSISYDNVSWTPYLDGGDLYMSGDDLPAGTVFYVDSLGNLYADTGIGLGDVVRLTYASLGINAALRIMAIAYDPYNPSNVTIEVGNYTKTIENAIYDLQTTKASTSYVDALQQATTLLNELISNSLGYYKTDVVDPVTGATTTYIHDASTLAASVVIYVMTESGLAWTDQGWNGGSPTWQYGITGDGNAVLKVLTALGINADWINAGTVNAARISLGPTSTFADGYNPNEAALALYDLVNSAVNSDFADGTTGWTVSGSTAVVAGELVKYNFGDSAYQDITLTNGHSIYISALLKTSDANYWSAIQAYEKSSWTAIDNEQTNSITMTRKSLIVTAANGGVRVNCGLQSSSADGTFDKFVVIDLTNAGLADKTAAEIDAMLLSLGGWFEGQYGSVKQGDSYQGVTITAEDGFVSSATIGGKTVVVSVNATDGIKVTVDGTAVFGVDSNGNLFANRIANTAAGATDSWAEVGTLVEGGTTRKGLFLFNGAYSSSVAALGLKVNASGTVVVNPDTSKALWIYPKSASGVAYYVLMMDPTTYNMYFVDSSNVQQASDLCSYNGESSAWEREIKIGNYEIGIDADGPYYSNTGARGRFGASVVGVATSVQDPASIAAQTGLTLSTITVTGAALGDFVLVSSSSDISELTVNAYVSAADTVTIRLFNGKTSTAIDLGSSTWKVMVLKNV